MATIDIKLKTYEQLQFEIMKLNTDIVLKSKEIERLKKENKIQKEKIEHLLIDLRGESEYKSRNEKAIEKLKTLMPICIMPNNMLIHGTEKAKTIEETLNILNGGDEE